MIELVVGVLGLWLVSSVVLFVSLFRAWDRERLMLGDIAFLREKVHRVEEVAQAKEGQLRELMTARERAVKVEAKMEAFEKGELALGGMGNFFSKEQFEASKVDTPIGLADVSGGLVDVSGGFAGVTSALQDISRKLEAKAPRLGNYPEKF